MGESKRRLNEKIDAFGKNPENFFGLDETIIAVRHNLEGEIELFVNPDKPLKSHQQAIGLIQTEIMMMYQKIKVYQNQKKGSGIVSPDGNRISPKDMPNP